MKRVLLLSALLLSPAAALAGEADVIRARSTCSEDLVCSFQATIKHDDEGWKHYANAFEVLLPNSEVVATRVLRHPHVKEQPFTRSIEEVKLPAGTSEVIIRARDSVHGHGGETVTLPIAPGGTRYWGKPLPRGDSE